MNEGKRDLKSQRFHETMVNSNLNRERAMDCAFPDNCFRVIEHYWIKR